MFLNAILASILLLTSELSNSISSLFSSFSSTLTITESSTIWPSSIKASICHLTAVSDIDKISAISTFAFPCFTNSHTFSLFSNDLLWRLSNFSLPFGLRTLEPSNPLAFGCSL